MIRNGEYWEPGMACLTCGTNLTNKSCKGPHPNQQERGWYCNRTCYENHGYGLERRLVCEERGATLHGVREALVKLSDLIPDTDEASEAWQTMNNLCNRLASRGW